MNRNLLLPFAILLQVTLVNAQEATSNKIIQRIQDYVGKTPVLYPALTLNQSKYAPGDTIYFTAHLMDAANRRITGRAILEMHLFNEDGKEMDRINFNTKDGVGYSQLVLSDTLPSGRYRIQVLNDWMRNFGTSTFFNQEISLVRKGEIVRKKELTRVNFFVEGGTLVQSVPNKVVAMTNEKNKTWIVADGQQREIVRFTTDHRGIGFWVFTPQLGISYSATMEGSSVSFQLPRVAEDGVAVLLTPNPSLEPVRLLMAAPKDSRWRQGDLSVMLISEQEVQYSASVNLSDREAVSLAIPQRRLSAGITELVVTDAEGTVVAQRSFLVNVTDSLISSIRLTKNQAGQRDFVRMDVALSDKGGRRLWGDFSVSAINQRLFANEPEADTPQPGNVNHIFSERYDQKNWASLNNELVSFKGFYDWSRIAKGTEMPPRHPLRSMIYKSGRVTFKATGQPVPDSTVLTVYLQKHFMGYEALVGKDGNFDIAFLFDFYGEDDLFYVAEHKGKLLRDAVIRWNETHSTLPPDNNWQESNTEDNYSVFASKNKLVAPSYNFYTAPVVQKSDALFNPNAEFEDEFMGADVTVNVEDYVVFPTMEEMIREIIPSLQHRRIRGNTTVRVVYSVPSILPTGDPMYIIDGVMTKRTDFFLSLKPADILIVKIEKELSKLTRLGAIGKNGIVYVQTKKKEIAEQLRNDNTFTRVQGLSKPVVRKHVNYETPGDWRKPDFRSTVYWNPLMKSDDAGEATIAFYLGDDVGPVKVRVKGFTDDGRPFSMEQEVNVSFVSASKN